MNSEINKTDSKLATSLKDKKQRAGSAKRRVSLPTPSTSNLSVKNSSSKRRNSQQKSSTSRDYDDGNEGREFEKSSPKDGAVSHSDALKTEFAYYRTCFKLILPGLSDGQTRDLVAPWLTQLARSATSEPSLIDRRNRLLNSLLVTVLNDEVFGWCSLPPPQNGLPDLGELPRCELPLCAWQADTTWKDILRSLPARYHRNGCLCGKNCTKIINGYSKQLDEEFKLLLHFVRPYVELYPDPEDKKKISQWIQVLSCITDKSCVIQKANRNDYITALFGYANNLQLEGPFKELPDFDEILKPLDEAVEDHPETPDFLDPTGPFADNFLKEMPTPEEGAFCFIAISGDLIATDL